MQLKVSAEKLNLRSEPKLTSTIVAVLVKGEILDYVSKSGDDYWYRVKRTLDNTTGWASHKYLLSLDNDGEIDPAEEFPWMPVAISEIGVKEFSGAADNPRIVEYLSSTNLGNPYKSNDETYWCSAFVNWCVERANHEGTDSAWARSWLTWGTKLDAPRRGCIVVFKRGSGGHVGFFISKTATKIKVLGGNQHDEVCYAEYDAANLLGYRVI